LFAPAKGSSATLSPLFSRGYTVIPEPQTVSLGNKDFGFGDGWRLELAGGVSPADVGVESLIEGLESRFHVNLSAPGRQTVGGKVIRLRIAPGSVTIGEALDRDKNVLAEQAYKMILAPDNVQITANAAPGLFYGVETLVQLVKRKENDLWLPEGEIVDWPDLQLREIYWDDAHHLDRLEVLKDAVRRAAFFKVNAFALKLDGHFQYKSAPALVEPWAFSPAQLQELTDYALRYYVQLIPYLDAPGHVSFILKHPEYAKLREYPENNYELCATNPDTYKLLFGMYQDLLDATKGAKYFHFGGDEAYFVGLAMNSQCDEATRAQELGSVGKVLAEFYTKTAGYIHDRGRTPMLWAYDPLVPGDVPSLPKYVVSTLNNGPKFDRALKANGIRETLYLNAVWGEAFFFPRYFILPSTERLQPAQLGENKDVEVVPLVQAMYEFASFNPARWQADLIGDIDTGWGDEGLHPETFWLGYVTGLAYAWHPGSPSPEEAMDSFFQLFYGPGTLNMARVYQLMSLQGQFWLDSWDVTPTNSRKPLFGSDGIIFKPPKPAAAEFNVDQALPLPPVPSPGYLTLGFDWGQQNARRLQLTENFLRENDELLNLLAVNYRNVEFHQYNLEVFIATAQLYRQNLLMLHDLGRINEFLRLAQQAAFRGDAEVAVADLDHVLDTAENIRQQRNRVLHDAVETWYKAYYPRVPEANGRRFLHELDDVKDHLADRTVNMSFLVNRELTLPLGEWTAKVRAVRNQYALAHSLSRREPVHMWQDTSMPAKP
jgi:hypothetical protein